MWKEKLYQILESLKQILISLQAKPPAPAPIPEPIVVPPPPPPVPPVPPTSPWALPNPSDSYGAYPNELKKNLIARVKAICLEEKLDTITTTNLIATIWGESGWNPYCINHTTKDYGLCQFSAIYYLKEYKMTPEEAINDPERCARIMAKNFKTGRASNWVAYSSGGYKHYLNKQV